MQHDLSLEPVTSTNTGQSVTQTSTHTLSSSLVQDPTADSAQAAGGSGSEQSINTNNKDQSIHTLETNEKMDEIAQKPGNGSATAGTELDAAENSTAADADAQKKTRLDLGPRDTNITAPKASSTSGLWQRLKNARQGAATPDATTASPIADKGEEGRRGLRTSDAGLKDTSNAAQPLASSNKLKTGHVWSGAASGIAIPASSKNILKDFPTTAEADSRQQNAQKAVVDKKPEVKARESIGRSTTSPESAKPHAAWADLDDEDDDSEPIHIRPQYSYTTNANYRDLEAEQDMEKLAASAQTQERVVTSKDFVRNVRGREGDDTRELLDVAFQNQVRKQERSSSGHSRNSAHKDDGRLLSQSTRIPTGPSNTSRPRSQSRDVLPPPVVRTLSGSNAPKQTVDVVKVEKEQKEIMHSGAEKAKLRREQEEAERQAAIARAKAKAQELADKLAANQTIPAAEEGRNWRSANDVSQPIRLLKREAPAPTPPTAPANFFANSRNGRSTPPINNGKKAIETSSQQETAVATRGRTTTKAETRNRKKGEKKPSVSDSKVQTGVQGLSRASSSSSIPPKSAWTKENGSTSTAHLLPTTITGDVSPLVLPAKNQQDVTSSVLSANHSVGEEPSVPNLNGIGSKPQNTVKQIMKSRESQIREQKTHEGRVVSRARILSQDVDQSESRPSFELSSVSEPIVHLPSKLVHGKRKLFSRYKGRGILQAQPIKEVATRPSFFESDKIVGVLRALHISLPSRGKRITAKPPIGTKIDITQFTDVREATTSSTTPAQELQTKPDKNLDVNRVKSRLNVEALAFQPQAVTSIPTLLPPSALWDSSVDSLLHLNSTNEVNQIWPLSAAVTHPISEPLFSSMWAPVDLKTDGYASLPTSTPQPVESISERLRKLRFEFLREAQPDNTVPFDQHRNQQQSISEIGSLRLNSLDDVSNDFLNPVTNFVPFSTDMSVQTMPAISIPSQNDLRKQTHIDAANESDTKVTRIGIKLPKPAQKTTDQEYALSDARESHHQLVVESRPEITL